MTYRVTPWSYSSLAAFEECPRRYKLTRLTKQVREKQTPALAEGNRVHTALEKYIKGESSLPPEYAGYKNFADTVKTAPGQKHAEYSFGLTKNLKPTGFWDSDVWVRGKLDVVVLREKSAVVIDWKTGKPKVDMDQLRLFAGAAFCTWPHIQGVVTGYAWLTASKLDPERFNREDNTKIWQEFAIRVHRMEEAAKTDSFPPRPSGLCRQWCPVGKALCEHCGE